MLFSCIALVCAGMDKNFWKEEGNPLKESLYASFRAYGIPGQQVMAAIEEGFRRGSTPYFQTVLDKAINLMAMTRETIAELEKVIGDADTLTPEVAPEAGGTDLPVEPAVDPTMDPTLASRLANSSVAVSSVLDQQGAPAGGSSLKEAWKTKLGLRGAGPR
jgi:hypothetical protein